MILGSENAGGVRQGYASAQYAQSLAELGTPLELKESGGWLLARDFIGEQGRDACGCYPLFTCESFPALARDFAGLPGDLVTVSLVYDPLTAPEPSELAGAFPDVCYHYKDHYIADLSRPLAQFVSAHHQRNARKAGQAVSVKRITRPLEILPEWNLLYEELVRRHGIRGPAAFSAASFAQQMNVPGLRAFVAQAGSETVGITLWMVVGQLAYYHLAAYSELGYRLKSSFALFWTVLEALAGEGIERVSLGGGAGVFAADEGLSRFKQGWSNEVRKAYFCGRVLDRERYNELLVKTDQQGATFFPGYRAPAKVSAA